MKRPLASLFLVPLLLATPGIRAGEEAADSKVDEAVQEALETAKIPCTNDKEGNFLLNLKFKTGRGQKVVILSGRISLGEDDDADEMRELYSVAFSSDQAPSGELTAKLLLESGTAKLGGWAVRKNGGKFETVYRVFIPAEACEHELMPAIAMVATQADSLEKSQTSKDEN